MKSQVSSWRSAFCCDPEERREWKNDLQSVISNQIHIYCIFKMDFSYSFDLTHLTFFDPFERRKAEIKHFWRNKKRSCQIPCVHKINYICLNMWIFFLCMFSHSNSKTHTGMRSACAQVVRGLRIWWRVPRPLVQWHHLSLSLWLSLMCVLEDTRFHLCFHLNLKVAHQSHRNLGIQLESGINSLFSRHRWFWDHTLHTQWGS